MKPHGARKRSLNTRGAKLHCARNDELKKAKTKQTRNFKKTITLKMEDGENGVEMQRINECAMIQIGRTVLFEDFPKSVKWQGTKRQVQGRSVSFPSNSEKRGVNCDEFMSL